MAPTIDNVLGETVNYTYDYLHRLTGATATNGSWGESYGYDGFGNLMSKTPTQGSAPAYQGATSQPNATGGALIGPAGMWDVENRLSVSFSGVGSYAYDPWGRRVWTQFLDNSYGTSFEAYFYGATGQKLESYNCTIPANGELSCALEGTNTYFAGRMISEKGVIVATDRLGSVRADSTATNFAYYPWGEERGTTAHTGRTLFAGYYRDAVGQDYAMARYYNATTGAFWSQDPGSISTADSSNPTSWNRYAFVTGDPINHTDRGGLYLDAEDCINDPDSCSYCLPGASFWGEPPGCDDDGGADSPVETPQQPTQTPPPAPIECEAELYYRPVDDRRARIFGATHSYWVIDEYDPNSGANTVDEVLSGGPSTVTNPKTHKTTRYLNVWTHSPTSGPDQPTKGTEDFSSGLSSINCAGVAAMISAAASWPQNTVLYQNAGPNSNTVAAYLAFAGGFNPTAPPGSYGW